MISIKGWERSAKQCEDFAIAKSFQGRVGILKKKTELSLTDFYRLVDIQKIFQQIRQIDQQLTLTLDNPQSVKLQVKQINLAQMQLSPSLTQTRPSYGTLRE